MALWLTFDRYITFNLTRFLRAHDLFKFLSSSFPKPPARSMAWCFSINSEKSCWVMSKWIIWWIDNWRPPSCKIILRLVLTNHACDIKKIWPSTSCTLRQLWKTTHMFALFNLALENTLYSSLYSFISLKSKEKECLPTQRLSP